MNDQKYWADHVNDRGILKPKYQKRMQEYIDQGLSITDAFKQAFLDQAEEILNQADEINEPSAQEISKISNEIDAWKSRHKCWVVGDDYAGWCTLIHAETRGKAKSMVSREFDVDDYCILWARRLAGLDFIPINYKNAKAAGFEYLDDSESDKKMDPSEFINQCSCEICVKAGGVNSDDLSLEKLISNAFGIPKIILERKG